MANKFQYNTGQIIDSSAIGNVEFAICMTVAWLVPRLVTRQRLYHRSLRRSPHWVNEHVSPDDVAAAQLEIEALDPRDRGGYMDEDPGLRVACRVVDRAMWISIAASVLFYVAAAITLGLLTAGLDFRTSYILVGISNFVASFYIFLLSYSAPQWLGVYASVYSDGRRIALGANLKALSTKVALHNYWTFMKVFPYMSPFFCGVFPSTIPISVIVGGFLGFFLCLLVDWGNRTIHRRKNLRYFGLAVAFLLILASAWLFSYGCSYVEEIWGSRQEETTATDVISFFAWLVGGILSHVIVWRISKTMKTTLRHSPVAAKRPQTFFGQSVYISKRHLPRTKNLTEMHGVDADKKKKTPDLGTIDEDNSNFNGDESNNMEDNSNIDESSEAEPGASEHNAGDDPEDGVEKPTVAIGPGNMPGALKSGFLENDDSDDEAEELDTTCHLINVVCCGQTCGAGGKDKSLAAKGYIAIKWSVWILTFAASLFFIMIMVGSMVQEGVVRINLPIVDKILYEHMNDREMCAFDDRGNQTRRQKVEATQRTFATPEEAFLAGYSILHCGACGKCSNWHDLRLEYTTRNMLGEVALECAKKTLAGGGYQTLLDCTMEKTGFQEPCARCWATDYQCTKKHCMWIGLRSFIINSVTNLQVGGGDITPSACEEAMCEATEITGYEGFVPCSGASRRRMNVTSTIARPVDQQCRQVNVTPWEDFFGPSTGYGDWPEGWGE